MGISAIHDYRASRIWHAGRTADLEEAEGAWWKRQPVSKQTNMGQKWATYIHIETTMSEWGNTVDIDQRIYF